MRVIVVAAGGLTAAVTLVASSAARPASPTLLSAGVTPDRHPTASWTIPPYSTSFAIEIAKSPQTASDGSFFHENVAPGFPDLLNGSQTSYLGAEQLDPGTYYLHVSTYDTSCYAAPDWESRPNDCGEAWSTTAAITVPEPPNHPPTLTALTLDLVLRDVGVKLCDDTVGSFTFRLTLSRTRAGHRVTRTRRSIQAPLIPPDPYVETCDTYEIPLPALAGRGRFVLTMTATDAKGARSRPVVRRWAR